MDDLKLKALLDAELRDSIGWESDGETAKERAEAWRYYEGDAEIIKTRTGKSRVVSTDVSNAINWMLPALLRVFFQGEHVGRFEPTRENDRAAADQATDYINYVLMRDNPGFLIFHNWFFDALLQKNGVVKHYWEEREDYETVRLAGLTEPELMLVAQDKDVEIVEQASYAGAEGVVYDVKVRRRTRNGRICIENVPPEEFLMSRRGKSVADTPFCAHRTRKTRSDLIAMGYDRNRVMDLPAYNDLDTNEEQLVRNPTGEERADVSLDPMMQEIQVEECYIRCDYDGDGIAELRRVVRAGNEIFENEEWDEPPFSDLTPRPMPHRWIGRSIADDVMPTQLVKTSILRQMMDNLYLVNNSRHEIDETGCSVNTIEDYLSDEPGMPIRTRRTGTIVPLQTPFVAAQAFPMLEYADKELEERTGLSRQARGLETDVLNNHSATAAQLQQSASQSVIELIARVFAEGGVSRLLRQLLRLTIKYQDKPRMIRLRDAFVEVDPRVWNADMDVSVSVGLGTGNRDREMVALLQIAAKQEQIMAAAGPQNPLVTLKQYHNTLSRLVEAAGLKRADPYFTDPGENPQLPPPPPDPKMVEAQQKMQLEAQKVQFDVMLKEMEIRAKHGLEMDKLAAELQLKREQMAMEGALKRQQIATDAKVKVATAPVRMGGEVG